jgi:hypothetical protein
VLSNHTVVKSDEKVPEVSFDRGERVKGEGKKRKSSENGQKSCTVQMVFV